MNRSRQFPRKRAHLLKQIRFASVPGDKIDNRAADDDCIGVSRDFTCLFDV